MAKQVVKLGLEFDTKAAIESYRSLVSEMQKGGADPKAIKQFTAAIEKAETELAQLAAEGSTGFTNSKGIEQYQKKVLKVTSAMTQLAARMRAFSSDDKNFPNSKLKNLQQQIEKLKQDASDIFKSARAALQKSLENAGFSKQEASRIAESVKNQKELTNAIEEERKKRAAINEDLKKAASNEASEIRRKSAEKVKTGGSLVTGTMGGIQGLSDDNYKIAQEAIAQAIRTGIKKGFTTAQIREQAEENLRSSFENVDGVIAEEIVAGLKEGFSQGEEDIESYLGAISNQILTGKNRKAYNEGRRSYELIGAEGGGFSPEITTAIQQMSQAAAEGNVKLNEATQLTQQLGQATAETAKQQEQCAQAATNNGNAVERGAQAFMDMSENEKKAQVASEQLEGGFNQLGDRLKYMFGFTAMFAKLRQVIRETFNDIQELDKAYASIAYVTNETVADLWSTYDEYAGMAEKLGQSTVDVIKASAIYRQQGLDTAEALELTTDTMKLATIAGNDYSTATQEMTAALRGFKMEMNEGAHVSDVYSELAAHAAAKVDDIAQAMSRTASIANSAGMSFENTSAFLTQMIETTQESAENIGTSMKTIIARFTELKKNVAGTSESEFEDLDFNKVDAALKSVGVQLKDTTGQFRNLDEVFLELSAKWDSLDRNTQRYIATVAAGSRQQSRFIAMMDNYERTAELIDIVADSEGKAEEQFSKAADTVEFKLNAIKTKWEEFKLGIMDSSFVKGALDKFNDLLTGLKNMKMPQIAFGSMIAIPAAKQFIMTFIQNIKKSASSFQALGKIISQKIPKIILQTDISKAEIKIKEIQDKIKAISEKRDTLIELKVTTNDKIEDTKQKIDEVNSQIQKLKESEEENKTKITELEQERERLNNELSEYAVVIDRADKEIKKLNEDEGKENIQLQENINELEALKTKSQGLSQAFSFLGSSLSMITGMLISGAKAEDIFNMMLISTATQAIPMAINAISSYITAKTAEKTLFVTVEETKRKELAKTAAMQKAAAMTNVYMLAAAGAIAAIAAIGKLIVAHRKYQEQLTTEYQLQQQINKVNELKQSSSQAKSNVENAKQELKTIEQTLDRYRELSKIVVKTTEEQEEYNNLVEQIRTDYPSIVESYNAVSGELKIQEERTQHLLDLQKQQVIQQQKLLTATNNTYYDAEIKKAGLEYDQNTEGYNNIAKYIVNKEKTDEYVWTTSSGNRIDKMQYLDFYELIKKNQAVDNLTSGQALQKALYQIGISQDEFLKSAGITDSSQVDWDELAKNLTTDGNDVVNTIKKSVETSLQLEKDQKQATIDYYNDMKQSALVQQITSGHENINEVVASGIAKTAEVKDVKSKLNLNQVAQERFERGGLTWHWLTTFDKNAAAIWEKVANMYGETDAKKFYEEKRKDKDTYSKYYEDFLSVAETYFSSQIAEDTAKALENNPKLLDAFNQFGLAASQGMFTIDELEKEEGELLKQANSDEEKDSIKNTYEEYKNKLDEQAKSVGQILENTDLSLWTGQDFDKFSQVYDNVIQKSNEKAAHAYIESLEEELSGLNSEEIAGILTSIDFSEATAYNWEQFKENGIQTIMDLTGKTEEESTKLFDNLARKAEYSGIYNPVTSVGDSNALQEQIAAREKVIEEHKDILEKAMGTNKPIKLTQAEIKKLKDTVDELGKAGVKLDLSEYLKGDTLNAEAFNKQLTTSLAYSEEMFDKAKVDMMRRGATQGEIEALETAREIALSYNQGLKEIFESWDTLDRKINDISSNLENIDNVVQQFIKDGSVSAESLAIIMGIVGEENVWQYVDDNLNLSIEAFELFIQEEIKATRKAYEQGDATAYQVLKLKALEKQLQNTQKEWDEQIEETHTKYQKSLDDVAKAQQDVIDKQKALNEAIEEYNKLLYGSDNRKSSLDLLYNYQQALSAANDEMARSKELFEDSSELTEASKNLDKYVQSAHNSIKQYLAENEVLKSGLASRKNNLLNGGTSYNGVNVRFGDYVKIDETTGLAAIDQRLLQNAKFADKWKDQLESFVDDYNKYSQELLKNEEQVRKIEKEIQDMRMKATKTWADFETSVAETLKNEYKDQIDALKDKYDSMKEADDDYISALQEAIEKQRKLREKENKWNDLATKEKKLSLMGRDTSNANQIERMKLQKEIEQDREQLLDESIDEVIDGMSKLYESQDELRQSEIELKEALLDDALYWNMTAENVAQSFNSVDEFLAWSVDHHKEYLKMTDAQKQAFLDQETQSFNEAIQASAVLTMNEIGSIEDQIIVTNQEVNDTIRNTSEVFTTEVERILAETTKAMDTELQNAINKIDSAKTALDEANTKLKEAAENIEEIGRQLYDVTNATKPPETIDKNGFDISVLNNQAAWDAYNSRDRYSKDGTWDITDPVKRFEDKKRSIKEELESLSERLAKGEQLEDYEFSTFVEEQEREWVEDLLSNYPLLKNHLLLSKNKIKYYKDTNMINLLTNEHNPNRDPNAKRFASGGLVNYTGPAWVDGSQNRPEAFLSAEDTERIGNAAKLLSNIPLLNPTSNISNSNNSIGDTNIEINLNIDNISSDVDIEEMLNRVKDEIVNIARPIGTNIILQQSV